MKAKELRIGNLIEIKFHKRKWEISKIKARNFDALDSEFVESRPIPLTPEWLEKFGCDRKIKEKGFNRYSIDNYLLENLLEGYTFRIVINKKESIFLADIQYVHMFQNLYFSLVGKELIYERK